ncbi:MAG: BamA/TamA family outer membrane protein [Emticicia sp.]|uniref:translocation and assembly module lipoprotein TamL n=1 Tax=Emticicia sp. TaxID=1930953 RepID=UPI003BA40985
MRKVSPQEEHIGSYIFSFLKNEKIVCSTYLIVGLMLSVCLSSCSVSKYIPEGESLYTGAKIKTAADSSFSKNEIKVLDEQLKTIIRPIPNSSIFGFPYKVWFYYVVGEPKKEKGVRNWFRKKFGEAPVLASKRAVNVNTEIIGNYLNNEGYFRSTATGELIIKGKKAEAMYVANVKPRYTISKVEFVQKDTSVFSKSLMQTKASSLLKVGEPYRFDNIKQERDRIDKALKLNGYYYFRPDFLIIKADSNQNARQVNLLLELKPNITQTSLKQYTIKDILVFVDNSDSTKQRSAEIRNGLRVFDSKRAFRGKVFNDAIGFRSGRLYNSQTHDASLSRLINLRNFKFVKNRFEMVNRSDSALINVIYDLTSLKHKSLQAEFNALTRSNNLAGTQLGVNWLNRNIFKGAEILKIGINTGFDFQLTNKKLNNTLNSYYRVAGDADLTFPRFLLPFYHVRAGRNQALPKTNINLGYERLVQKGVGTLDDSTKRYNQYTITSLRSSLNYSFRKNAAVEHNFTPLSINLIRPKNISAEFVDLIFRSDNIQDLLRYDQILTTRLILGGQYNIVYTPIQAPKSRHYFYLNAGFDIAGNLAGLFVKKEIDDAKRIANTVFEQYARFDVETRYYLDFTPSIRWANRVILGYGLPYGNSKSLPTQIKQYFVGGSNSIRAFRARSIGPGDFDVIGDSTSIFTTAYGDVKLELNSEVRFKFSQIINFAAFIDAGNIWMAKYNDALGYSESSVFGKNFYKQLAVGGGLGLRLDFTYVKLRLDLATPFCKPWLPEGERWVIRDIKPFEKTWRKQNLILNIAVDYPF